MLPFFFLITNTLTCTHTDHKNILAFAGAFVLSAQVELFYNYNHLILHFIQMWDGSFLAIK